MRCPGCANHVVKRQRGSPFTIIFRASIKASACCLTCTAMHLTISKCAKLRVMFTRESVVPASSRQFRVHKTACKRRGVMVVRWPSPRAAALAGRGTEISTYQLIEHEIANSDAGYGYYCVRTRGMWALLGMESLISTFALQCFYHVVRNALCRGFQAWLRQTSDG